MRCKQRGKLRKVMLRIAQVLFLTATSCGGKNNIAERYETEQATQKTEDSVETQGPHSNLQNKTPGQSSSGLEAGQSKNSNRILNEAGKTEPSDEMDQTQSPTKDSKLIVSPELRQIAEAHPEGARLVILHCDRCHENFSHNILAHKESASAAQKSVLRGSMPKYIPKFASTAEGKLLTSYLKALNTAHEIRPR